MKAAPEQRSSARCDAALTHAFGFLGKRWNGILLGALSHGAAGFAELSRAIDGIGDSMLSQRLTELGAAGLVTRTVRAGPPVTVVYELTESGMALVPALRELIAWGREQLD